MGYGADVQGFGSPPGDPARPRSVWYRYHREDAEDWHRERYFNPETGADLPDAGSIPNGDWIFRSHSSYETWAEAKAKAQKERFEATIDEVIP